MEGINAVSEFTRSTDFAYGAGRYGADLGELGERGTISTEYSNALGELGENPLSFGDSDPGLYNGDDFENIPDPQGNTMTIGQRLFGGARTDDTAAGVVLDQLKFGLDDAQLGNAKRNCDLLMRILSDNAGEAGIISDQAKIAGAQQFKWLLAEDPDVFTQVMKIEQKGVKWGFTMNEKFAENLGKMDTDQIKTFLSDWKGTRLREDGSGLRDILSSSDNPQKTLQNIKDFLTKASGNNTSQINNFTDLKSLTDHICDLAGDGVGTARRSPIKGTTEGDGALKLLDLTSDIESINSDTGVFKDMKGLQQDLIDGKKIDKNDTLKVLSENDEAYPKINNAATAVKNDNWTVKGLLGKFVLNGALVAGAVGGLYWGGSELITRLGRSGQVNPTTRVSSPRKCSSPNCEYPDVIKSMFQCNQSDNNPRISVSNIGESCANIINTKIKNDTMTCSPSPPGPYNLKNPWNTCSECVNFYFDEQTPPYDILGLTLNKENQATADGNKLALQACNDTTSILNPPDNYWIEYSNAAYTTSWITGLITLISSILAGLVSSKFLTISVLIGLISILSFWFYCYSGYQWDTESRYLKHLKDMGINTGATYKNTDKESVNNVSEALYNYLNEDNTFLVSLVGVNTSFIVIGVLWFLGLLLLSMILYSIVKSKVGSNKKEEQIAVDAQPVVKAQPVVEENPAYNETENTQLGGCRKNKTKQQGGGKKILKPKLLDRFNKILVVLLLVFALIINHYYNKGKTNLETNNYLNEIRRLKNKNQDFKKEEDYNIPKDSQSSDVVFGGQFI